MAGRRQSWAGASITDIEFRHGGLHDPQNASTARFYFRQERRSLDRSADTISDPEENVERLAVLKRRVRDSGLTIQEYRDPASLGEMIYDELIDIIERDFAHVTPRGPLDEERSKHAAFAASRRRAHIPNSTYLGRLNEWLDREDGPMTLYAESGSGKS